MKERVWKEDLFDKSYKQCTKMWEESTDFVDKALEAQNYPDTKEPKISFLVGFVIIAFSIGISFGEYLV